MFFKIGGLKNLAYFTGNTSFSPVQMSSTSLMCNVLAQIRGVFKTLSKIYNQINLAINLHHRYFTGFYICL